MKKHNKLILIIKKNGNLNLKWINMEFIKDLWRFMKERKKFWLAPIIFILLLIGFLLVIGGGSAVAPFIYTLF